VDQPHLDVSGTVWTLFGAYVLTLLALDLLVFNRKAHHVTWGEAARLSAFFVAAALAVNLFVLIQYGEVAALTFFTGYVVEVSLSVDNLFVIAVLFGYFGVPPDYQHRVLFWGILGAIIMRASLILIGVALVEQFHWVLYVFGAFLVLTGVRLVVGGENEPDPAHNPILKFLRRVLPVTRRYHGEHFFVRKMGRLLVTPLFLVLVMIELTDVVFAVDSIPAILGITTDPFLAFASNIMAVMGLRALYFLLAGLIERVRYLHYGLGAVLVFIGLKMLLEEWVHVPTPVSLSVVLGLIFGSVIVSWIVTRREEQKGPPEELTPFSDTDEDDQPFPPPASGDGHTTKRVES